MLDLLSFLILTPLADTTPSASVSDLTPYLLTSYSCAKASWGDQHYPIRGLSPPRSEYKVPSALSDERKTETTRPPPHGDSYTPSSQVTLSSLYGPASRTPDPCGTLEVDQAEAKDYDPEYAASVVASKLSEAEEDDMAWRRKNEEIYRIRNLLNKKRRWDDRTALLLGDHLLANDISRHVGDDEVKYALEDEHTMGKGTSGTYGHWRMRVFLHSKEKKRRRISEEGRDENADNGRGTKRRRTRPRGISKMAQHQVEMSG